MCKYDKDKVVELYKKFGGYKGILIIVVNGDGDYKVWFQVICNGWKNDFGFKCQFKVILDFKILCDMIIKCQFQGFFCIGWQMDYFFIENFLILMYVIGVLSNDNDYLNKVFDVKFVDVVVVINIGEVNKLYQEVEKMLVEDLFNILLWMILILFVWLNKVVNVKFILFGMIDFQLVSVK